MKDKKERNIKEHHMKEQLSQVNIREPSTIGVFQMLKSLIVIPTSAALHNRSSTS